MDVSTLQLSGPSMLDVTNSVGSILGAILGVPAAVVATLVLLRWLKCRRHGQTGG
jgi:hypothetical protein